MIARAVVTALIGLAVLWLAVVVLATTLQERLLFPGAWTLPRGPAHDQQLTVLAVELGATPLGLQATDGVRTLGWLYRNEPGRPAILYVGGNAEPIEGSRTLAAAADALGFDLLALSPRGFPGSDGTPDAQGFRLDARAAWTWLTGPGGVAPQRIVLHGRSMGAGILTALAVDVRPGGIVLESTYTSLSDIAHERFPLLPTRWLLRHHLDNVEALRHHPSPVLITHSHDDDVIPFSHGQALADALPAAVFLATHGLRHHQSSLLADPETRAAWERWLLTTIPPSPPPNP